MPDPVAAELYDLWKAGAISMPMVAQVYAAAAGGTHDTGAGGKDEKAFDRGSYSDFFDVAGQTREAMYPLGSVYPIWSELRDTLNTVLAKSAENLYDTGEALVQVGDDMAAKDAGASADLEELKRKHLESDELDQPPSRRLVPPLTEGAERDRADENAAPPLGDSGGGNDDGADDDSAPPFN